MENPFVQYMINPISSPLSEDELLNPVPGPSWGEKREAFCGIFTRRFCLAFYFDCINLLGREARFPSPVPINRRALYKQAPPFPLLLAAHLRPLWK